MPRNEEQLHGGNATDAVMRVGTTVRKPWQENTPAVHRFMEHLRDQGLSEVPRTYGKDPQDRQVVEFVVGTPAPHDRPLPADFLSKVGRWIRSIHDCAAGFTPAPGGALVFLDTGGRGGVDLSQRLGAMEPCAGR